MYLNQYNAFYYYKILEYYKYNNKLLGFFFISSNLNTHEIHKYKMFNNNKKVKHIVHFFYLKNVAQIIY